MKKKPKWIYFNHKFENLSGIVNKITFNTSTLTIIQSEGLTKIVNQSKYRIFISIIPIRPKRKYEEFLLIQRGGFIVFEADIDLTKVSFRFEDPSS